MKIVKAGACSFIPLGIRGENRATEVQFNISSWITTYGEGVAQLIAQRQSDASPYPVTTTQDGGTVSWVVTGADTAEAGVGSCELLYFVGETLAKSMTWSTKVKDSLDPADTDPPEPQQSWVEEVLAAADAVEQATTHQPGIGAGGTWEVWNAETAAYVDTGVYATGPTGATPDLTVGTVTTLIPGSDATVTITGTDEDPVLHFGIPRGDPGEVTEAELTAALDTKANVDGYYEDLVSGGTTQIITDATITDQRPYTTRAAGGGLPIGNRETDTVVGATMAWNQLVQNGNFVDTSAWIRSNTTISVASNTATITKYAGVPYGTGYIYQLVNLVVEHKVLWSIDYKGVTQNIHVRFFDTNGSDVIISDENWHTQTRINQYHAIPNETAMVWIRETTGDTPASIQVRNFVCFDLTAMFGSAIADRAYALEQAEAGSGIAWLQSYGFFTEDYYAYNAGELMSVNVSAHKMVGADASEHVYPLDSSKVLRGLYKLDDAGNIYCDGDTYESSGAVTRKYGVVDLGTLNWTYLNEQFIASLGGFKDNANGTTVVIPNARCTSYVASTLVDVYGSSDKVFSFGTTNHYAGRVLFKNSSYTDAATFKAAMSGQYLVYELATPTTETAEPFTNPQVVDPEGTEQYVDAACEAGDRDVEVPCGHVTEYHADLARKLVRLPDPAGTDGLYVVRQTDGQMELLPYDSVGIPPLTAPLTTPLVLDGTEDWALGTAYTNVQRFDLNGTFRVYTDADHVRGVAEVSKGAWIQDTTFAGVTELSLCFNYGVAPATRLYVLVPKSENITTAAAFKAWLAADPITVTYAVSGPYVPRATLHNGAATYVWEVEA